MREGANNLMEAAHPRHPELREPTAIVLLGPPGVGKGTQSEQLAAFLHIPHVSTGDILRDHVQRSTELGARVKQVMERGGLVPDDVMCDIVARRISEPDCQRGFVLDGFPRTLAQARALDAKLLQRAPGSDGSVIKLIALQIVVPTGEILRRLSGRRICSRCGSLFNVYSLPPRTAGVCDSDGARLLTRPDDDEDTVLHRLTVYEQQTIPLVQYYQSDRRLYPIDGGGTVESVTLKILETLKICR